MKINPLKEAGRYTAPKAGIIPFYPEKAILVATGKPEALTEVDPYDDEDPFNF